MFMNDLLFISLWFRLLLLEKILAFLCKEAFLLIGITHLIHIDYSLIVDLLNILCECGLRCADDSRWILSLPLIIGMFMIIKVIFVGVLFK